MNYLHVIWDFNGTIIDDLGIGLRIQQVMLSERGLPAPTLERYLDTFDFPIRDWYAGLGYDVSRYEDLAQVWGGLYDRAALSCGLNAGVRELLEAFEAAEIEQSVLSASHRPQLLFLLKRLGVLEFFGHVAGLENNLADGKMHLGRELIERTGLLPEKTLLIGDTTQDLLAANAIGCDHALVAMGHQSKARLLKATPHVYSSFAELKEALFGVYPSPLKNPRA